MSGAEADVEHAFKEQLGPKQQDTTELRQGGTQGPARLQGGVCGGAGGGNMEGEGGQEDGGRLGAGGHEGSQRLQIVP